ncbi:hypothetical protein NRS6096_21900 (plasmid) [Bacillus subtilis]|nr:hypothetical protein NRS6096_21900 [Bacillus subtilis]
MNKIVWQLPVIQRQNITPLLITSLFVESMIKLQTVSKQA